MIRLPSPRLADDEQRSGSRRAKWTAKGRNGAREASKRWIDGNHDERQTCDGLEEGNNATPFVGLVGNESPFHPPRAARAMRCDEATVTRHTRTTARENAQKNHR